MRPRCLWAICYDTATGGRIVWGILVVVAWWWAVTLLLRRARDIFYFISAWRAVKRTA